MGCQESSFCDVPNKARELCACGVISRNEKHLKAQSGRTPTADSPDMVCDAFSHLGTSSQKEKWQGVFTSFFKEGLAILHHFLCVTFEL